MECGFRCTWRVRTLAIPPPRPSPREDKRPAGPRCTASQFQSGSHEQSSNAAQPKMAVNQPLELDGDRESGSTHLPPPTADGVAAKAASSPHASQVPSEPGRVVIRVPRSFYFKMQIRNDDHVPTPEEQKLMVERTEKQIRTAVAPCSRRLSPGGWMSIPYPMTRRYPALRSYPAHSSRVIGSWSGD